MSEKMTNFVVGLWGVIGVLVLLGAVGLGIRLNHNRRVADLKKTYELESFGVSDFEDKVRKYEEEEVAWKDMLDEGAVPDKKLRGAYESNKKLYEDITEKKFSGRSLIEIGREKKQTEFNAYYEAENQWW